MATEPGSSALAAGGRWRVLLEYAALALLLAAMALLPLTQDSIQSFDPFAVRVLLITALTIFFVAAASAGELRGPPVGLFVLLIIFLALGVASAVTSPHWFGSASVVLNTSLFAGGFVLAAGLLSNPLRRHLALGTLAATAVTLAVIGVAQHLGHGWAGETVSGRVGSTYFNPNHYAGFLDLTAPLFLGIALYARSVSLRLACGALAALLLVNAGLTFSRGGWLAVSIACLVLVTVWTFSGLARRETRWRLAVFAAVLVMAGVAATYFIETSPRLRGDLSARIERLLQASDPTANARFAIYGAGLQVLLDNRLSGVGPGNFSAAVAQYRPARMEAPGAGQLHRTLTHALNDYIQVAAEKGVAALIAFLGFWLAVLLVKPSPAASWLRPGVIAGIGALMLHGMVDGNLSVVPANAFLAFVVAGLLHAPQGVSQRIGRAAE